MPGDVVGRDLHRGRHGAIVAEELLDGTVEELGVRLQEGRLRGMPEQMEESVSEQVRGRLVSREEEEHAVRDDLVACQAFTPVLGAEHEVHQVVLRATLALAEQRVEVVDQRGDTGARLDEVVALVDRAAEVRREPIGPGLDPHEVGLRHAHESGDDGRRERKGELADEVHRAACDDPVEESVDGRLDPLAARLELLRRERTLQESSQAIVVGRVAKNQPVPEDLSDRPYRRAPARVPLVDFAEAIGGERLGAVEHPDDVRVPCDHPGVQWLAPVDGVVVAEPRVEREWVLDVSPGLEIEVHRRGVYPAPVTLLKVRTGSPTALRDSSAGARTLDRHGMQLTSDAVIGSRRPRAQPELRPPPAGATLHRLAAPVARRSESVPYRYSTAYSRHSSGTPLRRWVPRSTKPSREPATRSLTVLDTSTSSGPAAARMRAAMWTAMPPTSSPISSHSPVWSPVRTWIPSRRTRWRIEQAQRIARAGPSNVASTPSPVGFTSRPRKAARSFRQVA